MDNILVTKVLVTNKIGIDWKEPPRDWIEPTTRSLIHGTLTYLGKHTNYLKF